MCVCVCVCCVQCVYLPHSFFCYILFFCCLFLFLFLFFLFFLLQLWPKPNEFSAGCLSVYLFVCLVVQSVSISARAFFRKVLLKNALRAKEKVQTQNNFSRPHLCVYVCCVQCVCYLPHSLPPLSPSLSLSLFVLVLVWPKQIKTNMNRDMNRDMNPPKRSKLASTGTPTKVSFIAALFRFSASDTRAMHLLCKPSF